MRINISKCRANAKISVPTYGSDGAACFDLYAAENGFVGGDAIPTGLCFEIPKGWAMLAFSRSGHGFNANIQLVNCVGVIDSDYRGEVMIKLTYNKPAFGIGKLFRAGERIAQALILPVPRIQFVLVDQLSETKRGANGFGSTGD